MKIKLQILLLSFLVSTFSFGQIKLEDLKIDTTITGFHYAADFQGTIVFTKNGSSDIHTTNPTAFSFTIAQNMSATMAKKQLGTLLNMSIQNGYKISDIVMKDTVLGGNIAFYASYTENYDGNNNLVFNAFVIKNGTAILFTSGDLDYGKYIDKFRKTFYTINL
jgi:hypothetical protein